MIRGVVYSKHLLVVSAIGIAAACTMALVRYHVASEWKERLRRISDLEALLSKQIAARSDCRDIVLNTLRARVGTFRSQLGSENAWECLVRQFGNGWTAEAGPRDGRDGYSVQIGTLIMLSPIASDWPAIVESIRTAEQLSGVRIARIEMKSSGSREHRVVDLVKIVVAIQSRRTETAP
jgi:hypothetical protein